MPDAIVAFSLTSRSCHTSNNRCILARQSQRRLYRTLNSPQALAASSSSTTSLVTKRFHWIEPRREVGWDQSRERTDQECTDTDDSDVVRNDFGWDRRKLINLARENLDVQGRCQPATELVTVTNQCDPKAQASDRSKQSDNCALTKEDPDNLRNVRPERLHNSDLVALLHRYGDERAHDSKSRHDHDEEQKEKHHCAFEPHRFEILAIHVNPALSVLRRLEELLDALFHSFSAVRIVGLHRDSVQRVSQTVQLLTNVNWHEPKFGIVQVMSGLENAGNSQFFRKNHIA